MESAIAAAKSGFRVFPCTPNGKKPLLEESWKEIATRDEQTLRDWWSQFPDANPAIALDANHVVIDVDAGGHEAFDYVDMCGLPETLVVATPSGGKHVYLTTATPYGNRAKTIPDLPGCDLRGANGYVLAPGASIDGKPYAVTSPALPAPCPDWLHEILRKQPREVPKSDAPLIELDRPESLERAKSWLETGAPDAVEGAGGDQTTYSVAARLRDFGLSQHKALDFMLEHWNERQSPPWQPDDLAVKVDNAFRYASGAWGGQSAAAEFDAIDIDVGEPPAAQTANTTPAKGRMHFLAYDEMKRMPEPQWLVNGVIQKRTAALIFGKSNTFKSFLAIDIGLSVATGRPWHTCAADKGRVLFVATEGANGVGRLRIPGWYDHYNIAEADRGNAYLYPNEISLDQKPDVDALIAAARALGGFDLIVFDIFGGTMSGTEVEDTTARAWVRAIQRIMKEVGAATLTIAHTGWQDETRARMHTHFWGSFDSRMRVEGDKQKMTTCLSVERHKDADSAGVWGFALASECGTLVPVLDESVASRPGQGWPESLKKAFEALETVIEAQGGGSGTEMSAWRAQCDAVGLTQSDNASARQKAFARAREGLIARGVITVDGEHVTSNFAPPSAVANGR